MKYLFRSPLILLLFFSVCQAQVVDESISGIQTGALGVWWHNEVRLSKNWAFRTELGYEAPIFIKDKIIKDDDDLVNREEQNRLFYEYPLFLPVGALETRWYYNSRKRQGNSKNTFHNSGNFASGAFRYYPEFLAYSPSQADIDVDSGLFLTLSWGMRRNINYRWNFEFNSGLGVDLLNLFRSGSTQDFNDNGTDNFLFNFTLRIGYKYGMKD